MRDDRPQDAVTVCVLLAICKASDVFSYSRIGSNSTNKQEDEDEKDEAPLQPGQLLPFPPAGLPPPLLTVTVASTSLSSKAYSYIVLSRWWVHVCDPALVKYNVTALTLDVRNQSNPHQQGKIS